MRKLFLVIFLFPFLSKAQSSSVKFPMEDGRIVYTEVVKLDSVPAGELYQRSKIWLRKNYYPLTTTAQLDDSTAGVTVVNGIAIMLWMWVDYKDVKYVVKVETRNGRYKYSFSDFRLKDPIKKTIPFEDWKPVLGRKGASRRLDKDMKSLIDSLKRAMKTPIAKTGDNW